MWLMSGRDGDGNIEMLSLFPEMAAWLNNDDATIWDRPHGYDSDEALMLHYSPARQCRWQMTAWLTALIHWVTACCHWMTC